ncbi:unnamed protein product [Clonostachys rosea f. rosea IK726]|uniref:Uncharacterized protein n=1 Tax=Clonostachys rosea f. rosea IK726 TaxID=1349383 RepID=A0ACA9TMQ2_BIOOC|nr:unnamed protein product [Clonostachys rosea f. rosea IK726]
MHAPPTPTCMSYTLQASRCYPVSNRPELDTDFESLHASRIVWCQCVEPYTFLEYKVYKYMQQNQSRNQTIHLSVM